MRRFTGFSILAAIFTISLLSCSRNIPEPFSPANNIDIPATPINLAAAIGDRAVYLTWSVSDTQGIQLYRVYHADSLDGQFSLLAEITAMSYAAVNLRNGDEAFFKISSVNRSDFEGYLSVAISATPNLYGIIINNGDIYANNRNVSLQLAAPTGTLYMQVSGDSSFGNSVWENYLFAREWELPTSDGPANVYARFRDSSDQTTSGYFHDTITLDTRAFIDSITFTPAGQPLYAGDMVHFSLFAGESDGQASAVIADQLVRVNLYDDGSRGDLTSGDGVYESDYVISNNLDIENATLFGEFTDRAGNSVEQAQARQHISIRKTPDPVSIISVSIPVGYFDRLQIQWSASDAADFAQYRIYRANSAGVDSSDYLLSIISTAGIVTHTDTGLSQNTAYYYRVYVVDNTGLWAASNESYATTGIDEPPGPASLFPLIITPDNYLDVNLQWNHDTITDFESFRIYSWRTDSGRNDSALVAVYTDPTSLSHVDHPTFTPGLDTLNYWYIVHTYDQGGHHSPSNVVRAHLVDNPPPSVSGAVIPESTSITIYWTDPQIPDFGYYSLLRDTLSTPNQAQVIYMSSDHEITTFSNGNLTEGLTYYYWLEVFDRRSHSSRTLLGSARW